MRKKKFTLSILLILFILILSACGTRNHTKAEETIETKKVDFNSLICTDSVNLKYATQYTIDKYGIYDLITIVDDGRFLLVPKGENAPLNLPENIVVLQQPLNRVYLVSTSAMDLIQTIGSISDIRLSGTKEESWHIGEAITAMEKKEMLYAGKYSAPDYELILNEGCNLAIENSMIYHNPEVKEKLEGQKIPVLVERSSYEEHPLGRLEWIKLYGVLFGKENEAQTYYESQLKKIEPILKKDDSGCSVAFFSVTSNGSVTVRKPNDYIAQMIEIAGGKYILNNMKQEEDNALSTMNMQMENFYTAAKDADILIYNSTIEGELESIDDLLTKNELFADFKAVKEERVFCTSSDFFQKSTGVCDFIQDLNKAFTDSISDNYKYLHRLR